MDSSVNMLNYTTANLSGSAAMPAVQVNVFYAIFIPTLIIVSTIMNLATIAAFWKLPSLREKPSELFLLNLSCADLLLTGMVLLPFGSFVTSTLGYWPTGENGCIVNFALLNLSIHGSLFGLTMISVDRFLLVYMEYPQYLNKVTRANVYKVIATGWALAMLSVVIELSLWNVAKDIDETARNITFEFVCFTTTSCARIITAVLFDSVLLPRYRCLHYECSISLPTPQTASKEQCPQKTSDSTGTPQGTLSPGPGETTTTSKIKLTSTSTGDLDKKRDHMTSTKNKSTGSNLDRVMRNRYVKPGITLIGLALAMASCMLMPYCLYVLMIGINETTVLYGLLSLQFSNAALDPFIYGLTRRKVRRFYKSRFLKIKCCITK